MKICKTCGIEKEQSCFKQHQRACKQCLNEAERQRRKEDPEYDEARRAYHREYYRANAEHLREISRAQESKPESKAKKAAYYRAIRDARTLEEAEAARALSNKKAKQRRLEKPEEVRATAARSTERKLARFVLLKLERPCYDCGGVFPPEAMDWDHRPGVEKCFDVSKGVRSYSEDVVIDEINKCQLVCACCHRIRTVNRRQEKV